MINVLDDSVFKSLNVKLMNCLSSNEGKHIISEALIKKCLSSKFKEFSASILKEELYNLKTRISSHLVSKIPNSFKIREGFIHQPFGLQSSIDFIIFSKGLIYFLEVKTSKTNSILLNNHIPNPNVFYLFCFNSNTKLNLGNLYLAKGNDLLSMEEYKELKKFKNQNLMEQLLSLSFDELTMKKEEIEKALKVSEGVVKEGLKHYQENINIVLSIGNNTFGIRPYVRRNFLINSAAIRKQIYSISDIRNPKGEK